MDVIQIAILISVSVLVAVVVISLFLLSALIKKQQSFENNILETRKFLEENSKEQAEAFTAIAKLVSKEAQDNFEVLKKMQQYNEEVYEKFAEDIRKQSEGIIFIQTFLNKLAEGLGFRTRSNLDDL
jgi:hypothetical protein